ncbi:MAG: hypothetical protein ACRDRX_02405 [Pseudonocardiaceae bacterium]
MATIGKAGTSNAATALLADDDGESLFCLYCHRRFDEGTTAGSSRIIIAVAALPTTGHDFRVGDAGRDDDLLIVIEQHRHVRRGNA